MSFYLLCWDCDISSWERQVCLGFGTASVGVVALYWLVKFALWTDLLVGFGQCDGDLESDHLLFGLVFHNQFSFEMVFLLSPKS